MNWKVSWPKIWNSETKSYVLGPVKEEFGTSDFDELLDVIEKAFVNGHEISVELTQWEPNDDDLCGEPPLTADEMHNAAWKQHQELHS